MKILNSIKVICFPITMFTQCQNQFFDRVLKNKIKNLEPLLCVNSSSYHISNRYYYNYVSTWDLISSSTYSVKVELMKVLTGT